MEEYLSPWNYLVLLLILLVMNQQRINLNTLKADSHITCRAHVIPLPCRAAKGLDCLSHLIYTVRLCLIHTYHTAPMPCSDHVVLLKATAQHGRRQTAMLRRKSNGKGTF